MSELREMVDRKDGELSLTRQCALLDLPRSTFYYKPCDLSEKDLMMMCHLDRLYVEDPTRGVRRMVLLLRKEGFRVGRGHVRTLMQKMRLKTVYCRPRTTIADPAKYKYPYLLRKLSITAANQVWALDITYIPMKKGYMYLLAIMDLHSRYIVGWSLSATMEAAWVVNVLREAVNRYGKPRIINSDQGSQFTSDEYVSYVKSLDYTSISMDGKGRATDNAFIERFFRTIKYEKIYLCEPGNGRELKTICREFIEYYNDRRGHSSIGDLPPATIYIQAA